jgi:hypothetical protein
LNFTQGNPKGTHMADDDKRTTPHPHPTPTPPGQHAPADRGARPLAGAMQAQPGRTDDKAAEENRQASREAEAPAQYTAEQLATPAPAMAGFRQMYVIVGPYRGNVLTMPDAEAESAKDNHWAVEMSTVAPPYDASKPAEHDHELTEEDRAYAVEAANAWAANVNAPPDEPPPEDETEAQRQAREQRNADRRTMQPGGSGGYQTRSVPDPAGRLPPSRTQPTPDPRKPK